jgi:hypothetical protein
MFPPRCIPFGACLESSLALFRSFSSPFFSSVSPVRLHSEQLKSVVVSLLVGQRMKSSGLVVEGGSELQSLDANDEQIRAKMIALGKGRAGSINEQYRSRY